MEKHLSLNKTIFESESRSGHYIFHVARRVECPEEGCSVAATNGIKKHGARNVLKVFKLISNLK